MQAQQITIQNQSRGDSLEIRVDNVQDVDGIDVDLALWDLRAVLKLDSDIGTTDDDALSVLTVGSGITKSGNDCVLIFPAEAIADVRPHKFELQATLISDPTKVNTLVRGTISVVDDSVKVSP